MRACLECLLPDDPPKSEMLWRYLTNGCGWEYVNGLPPDHPERIPLMRMASDNWAMLRKQILEAI